MIGAENTPQEQDRGESPRRPDTEPTRNLTEAWEPGRPPGVPVVVDAVRRVEDHDMVRCMYLSVTAEDVPLGWMINLPDGRLPFIVLGTSGVVCQPSAEKARFDDAQDIVRLFEIVEQTPGHSLEMEDIWLPAEVLRPRAPGGELRREHVFRVPLELFAAGFRYRSELLGLDQFVSAAREYSQAVEFSPSETTAFRGWNEQQIESARLYYRDRTEKALRWRDMDSG